MRWQYFPKRILCSRSSTDTKKIRPFFICLVSNCSMFLQMLIAVNSLLLGMKRFIAIESNFLFTSLVDTFLVSSRDNTSFQISLLPLNELARCRICIPSRYDVFFERTFLITLLEVPCEYHFFCFYRTFFGTSSLLLLTISNQNTPQNNVS